MLNYLYILPEIILTSFMSLIIIFDLFLSSRLRYISYYLIQLLLVSLAYFIYSDITFLSSNTSPLYDTNLFSNFFKIFILISLVLIFQYTYQFALLIFLPLYCMTFSKKNSHRREAITQGTQR